MPQPCWRFDNSYGRLPPTLYTRIGPSPVAAPRLVLFNRALAAELGLDPALGAAAEAAPLFAGNRLPEGAEPLAQAYAGHQFGYFNVLGDGRAILLGEHLRPDGGRVDLQLKGAGRTPYSRGGDGRAALGPMLREYLFGEAMHALGLPTTRALAVVTTGETVLRQTPLAGAILTRVAASHLRVGSFEYAARRGAAELRALLDYAVARHDPGLAGRDDLPWAFLAAVADRQADLVVGWMRVGFVHGVMNSDNMTISGETIDYGPCAFLDRYHPAMVFSSIDAAGRYAFGHQMACAQWNLARLAEALLPLDPDGLGRAEAVIEAFGATVTARHQAMMGRKLGLAEPRPGDEALIGDLLDWMQRSGADYTNTFRALSDDPDPALPPGWGERWRARAPVADLMRRHNPAYIPRNQRVEEALAAAEAGDLAPFERLLAVLAEPYRTRPGLEAYQAPPPSGAPPHRTFCGT
ncbi:MAG: hypothetical protein RLZZ501_554 [Pseudomonadota bacterium]|jgi:uncharacterized protein YdiU (UPF0061 family)